MQMKHPSIEHLREILGTSTPRGTKCDPLVLQWRFSAEGGRQEVARTAEVLLELPLAPPHLPQGSWRFHMCERCERIGKVQQLIRKNDLPVPIPSQNILYQNFKLHGLPWFTDDMMIYHDLEVSLHEGTPIAEWFIGTSCFSMDDWGVPPLRKPSGKLTWL